jgi:hypothetical protein
MPGNFHAFRQIYGVHEYFGTKVRRKSNVESRAAFGVPMSFSVTISGFRTLAQAKEFLSWYEGGGEQAFYDHLDCVGMSPKDGCNIDVTHKGNTGQYFDLVGNEVKGFLKTEK